jgi:hypothetical protein
MGSFPFLKEKLERDIFKNTPQKINPLNNKKVEMISISNNSLHFLTGK